MPYAVKHDPKLGIGRVRFFGPITMAEVQQATAEAVELQRQLSVTRFLCEVETTRIDVSSVEIQHFLDNRYREPSVRRVTRIALIGPPSEPAQAAMKMYEQACVQRGWKAAVFPDRRVALGWLTSRDE